MSLYIYYKCIYVHVALYVYQITKDIACNFKKIYINDIIMCLLFGLIYEYYKNIFVLSYCH